MFGLDARISLAIFGVLAVVAGAYSVLTLSSTYAGSFSQELEETGKAIEAIHNDLETDVHSVLINSSDKNAFVALYDSEVIATGTRARTRWLGPYIKATSPVHPRFGETRITKMGKTIKTDCYSNDGCYLWLVYDNVAKDVAKEVNYTFDGGSEGLPELEGRLQWQDGVDMKKVVLWYRASRVLGGVGQ
ncbi:MAG: hypothetical protein WAX89_08425 [Alphaproteobacteria bacterium]